MRTVPEKGVVGRYFNGVSEAMKRRRSVNEVRNRDRRLFIGRDSVARLMKGLKTL